MDDEQQLPIETDIEPNYVLVIGSAAVDIKGQFDASVTPEAVNLGQVRNSVGGVARNIAENLARLEVRTVLLSAVGDDAEGDRVVLESEQAGVNCDYVRHIEDGRTASTLSFLRSNGDLHLALSDMDITQHIDCDYLQQHEVLFSMADLVVVDATLPKETLETLFELTARYQLRVCADPTSPQLAAKLKPYINQLYLVVPNAAETRALCEVKTDEVDKRTLAEKSARQLLRDGATVAVVTIGGEGLAYAESHGGGFIRAANVEVLDPTGAGDAFSAAVIFGVLNEVAVDEAMRLGATAAALTLTTKDTVFRGLTQERLYDALVT